MQNEQRNADRDNATRALLRAEAEAERLVTTYGTTEGLDRAHALRIGTKGREFNHWTNVIAFAEEIARETYLAEEDAAADDYRAFGPDYFEGPQRHDPDLLDSHPMGEAVRLGPSGY